MYLSNVMDKVIFHFPREQVAKNKIMLESGETHSPVLTRGISALANMQASINVLLWDFRYCFEFANET